jgi:hypothetical protein
MMCKYRGETPLSQQWMAETMIKAVFYMRWPWGIHEAPLTNSPKNITFALLLETMTRHLRMT